MPRKERNEETAAMPDFEKQFHELCKTTEGKARILDFVRVLCEIIDVAVADGETWLTLGLNRNQKKVLITLHEGTRTSYAPATDLDGLLREVEIL